MDLQDHPFHSFQQLTDDTDTGVGQLKTLDLIRGGSGVGRQANSLVPTPPGPVLPW